MGGTELGCGFAGNFVAAFVAQAIAWENRLNLFIDKRIAEMDELTVSGSAIICFSRKMPCK